MTDKADRPTPALDLKFISHGTLESRDLQQTRKFYEEFLGFEVVKAGERSMWARLGGDHIYVVIQAGMTPHSMPFANHNGIDVHTDAEVDRAHAIVVRDAEAWGLHQISKPRIQHGTYSFYFWDADENAWEILSNPKGGYNWMFERGDQEGRGHWSKDFKRPISEPEADAADAE
ncbi:MAG: glyoxalase/bleomycin resistance protein/dioxygenase [Caulobacteraceae bacterium]|nr:glyoxalase/bleomycin resistance protein/dioxygenase [Caulobacteraceae bacterium]